ncbi:MAG: Rne/Rng family ribonuclease [FCB group bacterium]|jgi:ribonuclease G
MKKEIIINYTLNEVRIAITENGKLAELFIELPDKERLIGNIYFGKVNRIVQNINAAFIGIGLNQDAFLHFSDIDDSLDNILTDEDEEELAKQETIAQAKKKKATKDKTQKVTTDLPLTKTKAQKTAAPKKSATFKTRQRGDYKINLVENQNLVVQIVREAYSSKGVKVTSKIGIPGRYIVLMPYDNIIGVSKKIPSYPERKRLRQLAKASLPEGFGCIIRTACQNKSEIEIQKDCESLTKIWKEIEEKIKKAKEPGLLYQDLPIATSVIRDLFTTDVTRVVIDSKKLYKEITGYLKWNAPNLVEKVELHSDNTPIFETFGIVKELEQTYKRKVNLPTGGSIVLDQTEAMLVVDVNSGRSPTKDKQEKTAYRTNFEAAKEIARQIRLRDVGGIVLIDFIDMDIDTHRKKIYFTMKKELSRDRSKTVVYPLTQLNLLQITRQRVNQNISEKLSEVCQMCQGTGRVISKGVLSTAIERWLKNFRSESREFRLILIVHPHIAAYLSEGTLSKISRMMIKYFVKIKVQQSDHIRLDEFKFYSVRQEKDITQEYT